jgi:hypothetical protein
LLFIPEGHLFCTFSLVYRFPVASTLLKLRELSFWHRKSARRPGPQ